MMFRLKITALLCLFAANWVAADNHKSDWLYTVKDGDSVWSLCKTYVLDPQCWVKLVEYNQIKKARFLPPGSVLKFPGHWGILQPAKATVVSVTGEVFVLLTGQTTRQPLKLNQTLQAGDRLETVAGFATLKFVDGSQLMLSQHTQVSMGPLLHAKSDHTVQTKINLAKGRVRAVVEKIKKEGSHYQIITPAAVAAVAAVRGTDFRVSSSAGVSPVMITEVVTGRVQVANDVSGQLLRAGFASTVEPGKQVHKPVALLARVQAVEAQREKHSAFFPLSFHWLALEGAVSYKTQVFKVGKQDQLVLEKQGKDPVFTLDELSEGEYYLLVRGVDRFGIEGLDRRVKLNVEENL